MSALNHEVLAFDLYGTLVDPIAISQELATLLNIEDANRVAQLWRQKQIEYSFRVTMMDRYENFEYITMRGLNLRWRPPATPLTLPFARVWSRSTIHFILFPTRQPA